ncbi:MAG: hypothetical protein KDB07_06815 [Planctomycetes bacterium]|nr:hypothetical protein [Planctomycetota bacterium]
MFTREDFIDTIRHEANVIKHVASKIPGDPSSFRLAPNGRTTLELMRYMTYAAKGITTFALTGSFDHFPPLVEQSKSVDLQNFAAAIDSEIEAIVRIVSDIPESHFSSKRCKMPWGPDVSLGRGLVTMTQSFLSCYRMELFLHAKAAGNTEISTSNCWAGIDRPAQ